MLLIFVKVTMHLVLHMVKRKEGSGTPGRECVSCSGTGGDIGQIKGAGVPRLHLVTAGEAGNEGYRSWDDVAGGCIGGEKMARCS